MGLVISSPRQSEEILSRCAAEHAIEAKILRDPFHARLRLFLPLAR